MKLSYKDLFAGREILGLVWELDVAPKLFMKLRRLDKSIGDELKLFDPERVKLFQRHQQFIVDGQFNAPKPGEDGFAEFMKDYNEVFDMTVEIAWENEDIKAVEAKIEESKKDVPAKNLKALLDLLESFNRGNDEQKIEPVAVAEPVTV
jgi:hypothetical protein